MRKILTLVAFVCAVVIVQATAVSALTWPWENTNTNTNDVVAEQIITAMASGAMNATSGKMMPAYPWNYDDVRIDVYRGIALDTYTANSYMGSIDTRAAVLMRITHGGQESIYLIIGSEMHRMSLQGMQGSGQNWLIKLGADDGQQLLLFAHESNEVATVSGLFGSRWLINFEPVSIAYTAAKAEPAQPIVCGSSMGCGMIEEQRAPAIPVITKSQAAVSEVTTDGPEFWK
jgi:hypothetical protein